jgi:unsaturated rhamnogalacturonyl hydrolase
MKRIHILLVTLTILIGCSPSDQATRTAPPAAHADPWSKRIADSFVRRHPGAVTYDSASPNRRWNYEQGLMLVALHQMWKHTGDSSYLNFVRGNLEQFVDDSGRINTYELSEFNLDQVAAGKGLLALYADTGIEKYRKAADTLRNQLRHHPRTNEGGYWHKKIYPYQMWLDGLYMAQPFAARYAVMFNEPALFDDVVNQFVYVVRHTKDPATGLLYHAWDESKQQRWADPKTGCSPHFWGRALGWYMMALVDVLDFLPPTHPRRLELIALLREAAAPLLKYRDPTTGLWYQVLDQGTRSGNYIEASASCMFVYAFAKGSSKGYLDSAYYQVARESFSAILTHLVTTDANGYLDLHHTCRGAGLGGTPYRDGSFEYYITEPQRINDMKGVGPFLLAAVELERGSKKPIR